MTLKTRLPTLSYATLLAAITAYGCGSSSSTINSGAGGTNGSAGHTGAGGGVVIITSTGGTSGGTGGRLGGTGGAVGTDAGSTDAGAPICRPNAACTTGFICTGNCNVQNGGGPGTRACMCGPNNTLMCMACMGADGGTPPADAGPVPDAGSICAGNVRNGRPCVLGASMPCTRNAGGGMTQSCTCQRVADGGIGGGAADLWSCQ